MRRRTLRLDSRSLRFWIRYRKRLICLRQRAVLDISCSCRTLILAGTDTTALTASWVLWELAKDPAFQDQVREEIKAARAQVTARGDADFTIADLDSLTLLQAALKVCSQLELCDILDQDVSGTCCRKECVCTLSDGTSVD